MIAFTIAASNTPELESLVVVLQQQGFQVECTRSYYDKNVIQKEYRVTFSHQSTVEES